MSFKVILLIFSVIGIFSISGCNRGKGAGINQNNITGSGINCDAGFTPINAVSIDSIIKSSSDSQIRTVTLKSSVKHGYEQSAYNLSDNCFSRNEKDCRTDDQIMYNHGGNPKGLRLNGHFILLDKSSSDKFAEISLDNLDKLNLKTADGSEVFRDTIFGNPSTDRNLALGESSIDEYDKGSIILGLVDSTTWSTETYQLFKMKIEKVLPGEEIVFSYQKIAVAPEADLRNFVCSKRANIKKNNAASEGEAIVYDRKYAGWESSTFGFDYGVNGFDGRFVQSERVMSFSKPYECAAHSSEMCVSSSVGRVVGYWGGIIDLGDTKLADVKRSSWPNLQNIAPDSAISTLRENRTYLISQLNDDNYSFGAIRINEIDPQGRWVKLNWKRIAIESPFQFVKYNKIDIPSAEMFGSITLGSTWWTETHFDIVFAKRNDEHNQVYADSYFDVVNNTLTVDNRYFPSHSGIVEVTGIYRDLNAVPENTAESFINRFNRKSPIKIGSIYVLSLEKFWYKASLAVQVVDFIPGKSVKLKYKRLFNAQTFPGKWN